MTKCSFCGKELPERGFTHYPVCETRTSGVVPACNACIGRYCLKMCDIVRAKGREK
jgi:hypothetical protein